MALITVLPPYPLKMSRRIYLQNSSGYVPTDRQQKLDLWNRLNNYHSIGLVNDTLLANMAMALRDRLFVCRMAHELAQIESETDALKLRFPHLLLSQEAYDKLINQRLQARINAL